jgi:hypothetical protein
MIQPNAGALLKQHHSDMMSYDGYKTNAAAAATKCYVIVYKPCTEVEEMTRPLAAAAASYTHVHLQNLLQWQAPRQPLCSSPAAHLTWLASCFSRPFQRL